MASAAKAAAAARALEAADDDAARPINARPINPTELLKKSQRPSVRLVGLAGDGPADLRKRLQSVSRRDVQQLGLGGGENTGEFSITIQRPSGSLGVNLVKSPEMHGVSIAKLVPSSDLAQARARKNDIIISVNGHRALEPEIVKEVVSSTPVGSQLAFVLVRPMLPKIAANKPPPPSSPTPPPPAGSRASVRRRAAGAGAGGASASPAPPPPAPVPFDIGAARASLRSTAAAPPHVRATLGRESLKQVPPPPTAPPPPGRPRPPPPRP